ncbi:hypothetical protein E2C01_081479 [Portunus trituberculatus]|uniref:Uncharacterized protein n=1 Tax=Portunus trituberculatus TaxID=210409 RepID=A0A5B7J2F8_PORTR|nr:hypothetical protein [Portunus trituberculatus]
MMMRRRKAKGRRETGWSFGVDEREEDGKAEMVRGGGWNEEVKQRGDRKRDRQPELLPLL